MEVVFAPNTTDENFDMEGSATVAKRVADIHTAFADKSVKGIFTVIGGFNSNQLVKHLDYDLIAKNPKVFSGFSDITALHAAIYTQTKMVTYYGPHYSSLGMLKGCDYTLNNAHNILFENDNFELKASGEWADDAWYINQEEREFIKNVYPAIPVVFWYALDIPPSIMYSLPSPFIGLSPSLILTGT